jgi:DNA-binding IclR family transcriptional regulator
VVRRTPSEIGQMRIMYYLNQVYGDKLGHIARHFQVNSKSLWDYLSRMERDGLVERYERGVYYLGPKGSELLNKWKQRRV